MIEGLFWLLAIALCYSYVAEIKENVEDSTLIASWKYFSYYTTLTNLLVFLWLTVQIVFPSNAIGQFAKQPDVSAAVTFYITSVGISNYLLFGWQPMSFFKRISDLLVHAVTPIATLLYWVVSVDKTDLGYATIPYWLIYPLSYAAYTALHGNWTRFYPYDFTNVELLGAKKVAFNALFLSLCSILGAYAFVLLGKGLA